MRIPLAAIGVWLMLLTAVTLGDPPATAPSDPRAVEVTIELDKEEYFLGENVLLHWRIRNTGGEPFTISMGGDTRNNNVGRALRFKVEATDEDGRAMVDPYPNPMSFGGMGGGRTLKAGEEWCDDLRLMRYREFDKSGTYAIRVYHGLGWGHGDRHSEKTDIPENPVAPIAETKVRLAMPDVEQAKWVVRETLQLPTDANRTWGQRGRVFADFELLRYPVYLPLMKELAQQGDARAVTALGAMRFPEATAALVELADGADADLADKARKQLMARLPPIDEWTKKSRQGYLAASAWDDATRAAVVATAWQTLAESDAREPIVQGAYLLRALGGPDDLPPLIKLMDRVLTANKRDPTEQDAYPRPSTASGALIGAAEGIVRRGAESPADATTPGRAVAFLVGVSAREDFRPEGWRETATALIEHEIACLRELAILRVPKDERAAFLDAVVPRLKDSSPPVQAAACGFAYEIESERFASGLIELLETTNDKWIVGAAFRAAAPCGAPRDRLLEICLARLGTGDAELNNAFYSQLLEALEHKHGYGGQVVKDWGPIAPGLREAWGKFIADNREALRAGRKFPIGEPPVVAAMVPPGMRFGRGDKPAWPEAPATTAPSATP
jgi:hypothetical protein